MRWLVLVLLLILLPAAAADGIVYSPIMGYVEEHRQLAFITYEEGVEELLIAVETDTFGNETPSWILPVPAPAEEVGVDHVKGFPQLRGDRYELVLEERQEGVFRAMLASQLYPVPWFAITRVGTINADVHMTIEKHGITSEVVSADGGLDGYLRGRNISLPSDASAVLDEYEGYAFVVSRVTGNVSGGSAHDRETPAILLSFPSEQPYFPLKLTSVYDGPVPAYIYVTGFWESDLGRTEHRIDKQVSSPLIDETWNVRYTEITLRDASSYDEDLWLLPSDAYGDLEFRTKLLVWLGFPLFLVLSMLAASLAGLPLFRWNWRVPLLGLWNVLSIIGIIVGGALRAPPWRSMEARGWTRPGLWYPLVIPAPLLLFSLIEFIEDGAADLGRFLVANFILLLFVGLGVALLLDLILFREKAPWLRFALLFSVIFVVLTTLVMGLL